MLTKTLPPTEGLACHLKLPQVQWWAQLTQKLASIIDNPLTQKLASREANAKPLEQLVEVNDNR